MGVVLSCFVVTGCAAIKNTFLEFRARVQWCPWKILELEIRECSGTWHLPPVSLISASLEACFTFLFCRLAASFPVYKEECGVHSSQVCRLQSALPCRYMFWPSVYPSSGYPRRETDWTQRGLNMDLRSNWLWEVQTWHREGPTSVAWGVVPRERWSSWATWPLPNYPLPSEFALDSFLLFRPIPTGSDYLLPQWLFQSLLFSPQPC